MSRRLILMTLVLALAVPAFAQFPLHRARVEPMPPTTVDDVRLLVPVPCLSNVPPVIQRGGTRIRVILTGPEVCTVPPILPEQPVMLGQLPPATYHVTIEHAAQPFQAFAEATFEVVEAQQPFEVRPYAVTAGVDTGLELYIAYTPALEFCRIGGCRFFVGGIEATRVRPEEPGAIVLRAPVLHGTGLVDVTVMNQHPQLVTARNALYYYDPSQPPDFALFERILFPILFSAPGANGSQWRTEAAISNPRPWNIQTYNEVSPIECVVPPCGERHPPRSKTTFAGGDYPSGALLLVPRKEAPSLAFSLRVRDVSRVAEGFGTEIPVVREADMHDGVVTLVNVPLDARHRVKLRIYSWTSGTVRLYLGTAAAQTIPLSRSACTTGRTCAELPFYATVDLPSSGGRTNVFIEPLPGMKTWAFATVTNNETQQVTTVTPNGRGAVPCRVCRVP